MTDRLLCICIWLIRASLCSLILVMAFAAFGFVPSAASHAAAHSV
jgi:hypothetical protein